MSYDLFFNDSGEIGFTLPRLQWRQDLLVEPFPLDMKERVRAYLGSKPLWYANDTNRIGFGACASVEQDGNTVRVSAALNARNIYKVLLTLDCLFDRLNAVPETRDPSRLRMQVTLSCGRTMHSCGIEGIVSEKFKQSLSFLQESDLEKVTSDMSKVWRATNAQSMKKYSEDCYVRIKEDLFFLGCFGNACDVGMYPDIEPMFSCHNLDSSQQQATLLAGLASLYEKVRLRSGI